MDIKLNVSYYASIILDAFKDLLCSKLCWNNRPGPTHGNANYSHYHEIFICIQLHEFMGVLQEEMWKIHQQLTLCRCNNHFN